ncbi:MAG: cyclic nucleotide-binding domain-containing protein [Candidatus Dormibacteraeota bacterium]|nr:cyclic nucleotide-binding domain-containing protein [Candidatus Dormibacteraeota bacterium]
MATTREDVIPTLERMPLFRGLSQQELEAVADRLDDATYLAGHGVITEGMAGPEFFIILDGAASVIIDDQTVATLGPGDFFGEVAALDGGPRTATVRAETQLRCVTLPVGGLRQFLLEHPVVAVNLVPEIARRFRDATAARKK